MGILFESSTVFKSITKRNQFLKQLHKIPAVRSSHVQTLEMAQKVNFSPPKPSVSGREKHFNAKGGLAVG